MRFYDPKFGYENWVSFLLGLKEKKVFSAITPTLIFNYDDPEFERNIILQRDELIKHFGGVMYRNTLDDEGWYDDIELLPEGKTMLLLDYGYIPSISKNNVIDKLTVRLNNIKANWEHVFSAIILAGTTYPNNLNEYIGEGQATFEIGEVVIFNDVRRKVEGLSLQYGDYGSVNPVRNDDIKMARGWIPRIEVALQDKIYMYRYRRPTGESEYQATYERVAKDSIADPRFPLELADRIWGIDQILIAASGYPPSKAPNHWIAVRMNIHIHQQVERLASLDYFSPGKKS